MAIRNISLIALGLLAAFIAYLPSAVSVNSDPIVFLHGFAGWGRNELLGFKYWGGFTDLEAYLTSQGYPSYTVSVGPVSSNWDRACEMYAQLVGGTVDYGEAHSKKYGHARYGRTYPGLITNWGQNGNKIHIVAHSQGGQTARMLINLLINGDATERATSGSGVSSLFAGGKQWVRSLASINSPHDGTTLVDVISSANLLNAVQDIVAGVAGFAGISDSDLFTIDNIYDLKLDHFGMQRLPGERLDTYFGRVKASPIWQENFIDLAPYDLSPAGAIDLNKLCAAHSSVYYFSFASHDTYKNFFTGNHLPNALMWFFFWPFATGMGSFTGPAQGLTFGSDWFSNDGVVNTRSMSGPHLSSSDAIVSYDGLKIYKGKWNYMGDRDGWDHAEVIGIGAWSVKSFYLNIARMQRAVGDETSLFYSQSFDLTGDALDEDVPLLQSPDACASVSQFYSLCLNASSTPAALECDDLALSLEDAMAACACPESDSSCQTTLIHSQVRLLEAQTLTINRNNGPIVLVHGFAGWGPSELLGFKYWGGLNSIEDRLKDAGYSAFTAVVGPFSSNWDRACELYAYIKGGKVDYGAAHSALYKHDRYGRTFPGLVPDWGSVVDGEVKKIHLVGHSMGGQTIRMLLDLLVDGDAAERAASGSSVSPLFAGGKDWITSLTTISSPHDGTTLVVGISGILPLVESLVKGFAAAAGISDTTNLLYDFKMDQFGLTRKDGESFDSYFGRVKQSNIWNVGFKDLSPYDLSPAGARDLNKRCQSQPNVYYFSYATQDTYSPILTDKHFPNLGMWFFFWPFATIMGSFTGNNDGIIIDKKWFPNDGVVNTQSCVGPTISSTDKIASYTGAVLKGQWNYMGIQGYDHAEIIGVGVWSMTSFYRSHASILYGLPSSAVKSTIYRPVPTVGPQVADMAATAGNSSCPALQTFSEDCQEGSLTDFCQEIAYTHATFLSGCDCDGETEYDSCGADKENFESIYKAASAARSESSSGSSNVALIAGASAGGVAIVGAVVGVMLHKSKKRSVAGTSLKEADGEAWFNNPLSPTGTQPAASMA